MSTAKVLRLDEYRDRRRHRLALSRSLHQRDRSRAALFEYLVEISTLTGCDRASVVWVDEYGPGLVHPHVVVDLFADRANRTFSSDPLHRAWDCGIPGAYDEAADRESPSANAAAIALGSDGSRGWFVVADSVSRRARLDPPVRDRLMFLAGECSAVVLHRDLDLGTGDGAEATFAGWTILKDLEGHDDDEARNRLVSRRFSVGRLAHMMLDEDLSVPIDRRAEEVSRVRAELLGGETASEEVGATAMDGPRSDDVVQELDLLEAVLAAYETASLPTLAMSLLDLGAAAERQDHIHGALDLYSCAYEVAVAIGEAGTAIDAARFSGRVMRRRAEWKAADSWYGSALEISRAAGLEGKAALSLNGLGLIARERGNLPAARAAFGEALTIATAADDRDALGAVYNDFMGLEHLAGNLHDALRHGWRAVNTYGSEVGRLRCMAGMGGVLMELEDWQAAEDAYTVVVHHSREHYYLVYAYDALAYLAALRGQADEFDRRTAQSDAHGWESGPLSAKAEVLCYRGLGLHLLGRTDEARVWLERAADFASEHEFGRIVIKADAALDSLAPSASERLGAVVAEARVHESAAWTGDRGPAPPDVRDGLRAMRTELAGSIIE
jgi:tetratricopeptide (TPR) repeat protein